MNRYDELLAMHDSYGNRVRSHVELLIMFGFDANDTYDAVYDGLKAKYGGKMPPNYELVKSMQELLDSFEFFEKVAQMTTDDIAAVWSFMP